MLRIEDARLPGLADLSQSRLCAITGAEEVDLLRLRYRPGKRAILHVATRTDAEESEGALWFFGGDKGRRIARRNKRYSQFDPETNALFEPFPQDHRMPQIRRFLDQYQGFVRELTGLSAGSAPVLLRYRPGLSCTFRCALEGGRTAYVKLVGDDDPVHLSAANRAMQVALAGSGVSVAPVLGVLPELGAIAYGAAPGQPLDSVLTVEGPAAPLEVAIAGLRRFWRAEIAPARVMGPEMLLARARESAEFVAVTAPGCSAAAAALVTCLRGTIPKEQLCPIHGDMKLEHLFLDGGDVVLIDTESVSLGLADYDLAQLYGRLWQAELEGLLPKAIAKAAADFVRSQAGPAFDWCLDVVALRLAKFYAQRPGPDTEERIRAIIGRLL